ncbi:MAG: hypothetical protein V4722_07560 [Bacteroidota bacterium]
MKLYIQFSLLLFLVCNSPTFSQSIGIGTTSPNSAAQLDISSSTKGILIPRMTQAQRVAIATPPAGLIVYQTTANIGFYYHDGTKWNWLPPTSANDSSYWKTTGNNGTADATHFIGTTDSVALNFKVYNKKSGRISPAGETFFGYQAGNSNTAPTNTGFGQGTLYTNTTGWANTAVGYSALNANSIGVGNTASGYQSLFSNTVAEQNTGNGFQSLYTNSTGNNNTAIGSRTLFYNTTGSNNTATGSQAMYFNTTGGNNTASGYYALFFNTTGAQNTVAGHKAMYLNTTGFSNTANGNEALYTNSAGFSNTAIGTQAMYANTTGNFNTATGQAALYTNTTGSFNTSSGYYSLFSNTTGNSNTATGYSALGGNTTGYNNTATGVEALYSNTTGYQNTATGFRALTSNGTGIWNTANGWQSLWSNSTGNANTGFGYQTLNFATTANFNTGIGHQALLFTTTGAANTTLGAYAGSVNTTGTNNIAIGYNANFGSNNLTNAGAIGYNAVVNTSNSLVLGNGVKVGIGISSPTASLTVNRIAGVESAVTFNGSQYASCFNCEPVTENVLIQAGKATSHVIINPVPGGKINLGGLGQSNETEVYGKMFGNTGVGSMNMIPIGIIRFHAYEDDDYIVNNASASFNNVIGNLATAVDPFGGSSSVYADNLGCVIDLSPSIISQYSNIILSGAHNFNAAGGATSGNAYLTAKRMEYDPANGFHGPRIIVEIKVDDFPNTGRCSTSGDIIVYGIR